MRLLVLFLLLSPIAHAADLDAMCTWSGARWDQSGVLRIPGTDVPFAEAWSHDGVALDGTLGIDASQRVRFRVDLRGAGLVVRGDIDPAEDSVFNLDDVDVPLGLSAMLVHGALFAIAGRGPGGGVVVGPHAWAAESVWSPGALGIVPCEELTVHWRAVPEEPVMLAAVGFPADAPEKMLAKGRSAKLYAGPNGAWVGTIAKVKYFRMLRVAEEQGGWSHVALTHWTGTVWHGWVRSSRLDEPVYSEGGGILGGLAGAGEPRTVRRCPADQPLRVRIGGEDHVVGTVQAGTMFEVAGYDEGSSIVTFPDGWLSAADGASFVLTAADAASCPAETWTPPKSTFDGLLGD